MCTQNFWLVLYDIRNKGGDIINTYELEIINLLLSQDTVHYSDIGEKINRSKKTIAKYLDHIEGEVLKYGVKLNRKRNVEIYFSGNIKDLVNNSNLPIYNFLFLIVENKIENNILNTIKFIMVKRLKNARYI